MKARHKRFALIAVGMAVLALGAWLIMSAFNKNMNLFYTPSEIFSGKAPQGRTFRMGGMVEKGSVQRQADGVTVQFVVTDTVKKVPVHYKGILPDLFKEGKGVVAQGMLGANGEFEAAEVLAKHDENYMPPDAAYAVKRAQEGEKPGAKPGTGASANASTAPASASVNSSIGASASISASDSNTKDGK